MLTLGLQGNLVTDAWIASTVEALSEYLVTFDRDFKRLLPARDLTLLDWAS
jgi:predicted nucleic acid-binding protein